MSILEVTLLTLQLTGIVVNVATLVIVYTVLVKRPAKPVSEREITRCDILRYLIDSNDSELEWLATSVGVARQAKELLVEEPEVTQIDLPPRRPTEEGIADLSGESRQSVKLNSEDKLSVIRTYAKSEEGRRQVITSFIKPLTEGIENKRVDILSDILKAAIIVEDEEPSIFDGYPDVVGMLETAEKIVYPEIEMETEENGD